MGKGVGQKGRPKTITMGQIDKTERDIKTLQMDMEAEVSGVRRRQVIDRGRNNELVIIIFLACHSGRATRNHGPNMFTNQKTTIIRAN